MARQNGTAGGLLDGYIDVAERIRLFYERFPNGRLTREGDPEVVKVGDRLFVMYRALAYRDPHDTLPGKGVAWEPFPGPTKFTRDSELMNAETAAWGRAIVSLGIGAQRIASREEVENRQAAEQEQPKPSRRLKSEEAVRLAQVISEAGLEQHVPMKLRSLGLGALEELTTDQAIELHGWATTGAKAGESA